MSPPAIGNRPPAILPDILLKAILLLSQPKSLPSRRRFAPMSLSRSNFSTPQALADWLQPRLPSESFASWGVKPGTKNIHNLWLELSEGEISLADAYPPLRTVNVVTVRVLGKDDLVLVESHQEMSDGSVRDRFRPLSEKMKPGETPEEAVARAVREELASEHVKILPGSYSKKVEERNSLSYPGLPACYVLHSVDAVVEGLPEGEFCTEEDGEYEDYDGSKNLDRAISVRKHYWKWVEEDFQWCVCQGNRGCYRNATEGGAIHHLWVVATQIGTLGTLLHASMLIGDVCRDGAMRRAILYVRYATNNLSQGILHHLPCFNLGEFPCTSGEIRKFPGGI